MNLWYVSLGAHVAAAYTTGIDYARTHRPSKEKLVTMLRPHFDQLNPKVHGISVLRDAQRDQLADLVASIILNALDAERGVTA